MTYILAASVPDAPASPSFGWATDNSINVLLALTEESNGALFSSHELWIAIGEDGQDFTQVKSYIPTSQSL
jgi:membrane-associated PAP2 superfamily phosphatase